MATGSNKCGTRKSNQSVSETFCNGQMKWLLLLVAVLFLSCGGPAISSSSSGSKVKSETDAKIITSMLITRFQQDHKGSAISVKVTDIDHGIAIAYVTVEWSSVAAEHWKIICKKVSGLWKIDKQQLLSVS